MKAILKQLFNHERYQTISILLVIAGGLWFCSCQSTTRSLLDPNKKITAEELQGEAQLLIQRANSGMADIQAQDAIKQDILTALQAATAAGSFNFGTLLTAGIGLLGSGAVIDNFRKRKDVKKLELQVADLTKEST